MRAEELIEVQRELGRARPPLSHPPAWESIGGCFVCFARGPSGPGRAGDEAWAAAATLGEDEAIATATGRAGAAYQAGLLALRELPLLERAVQALPRPPGVLLVDATGRDHPRRAGLALHLGAVLDLPTVGVTHRPLAACGEWPADESGARSPLLLDGELVGYWLRTRRGRRPLAVHAAWRTDPDIAVEVVLAATRGVRTPEPLRRARRAARELRAA
jgi:deoxyribonuclease V